jgi:hypothetical protein
LPGTQSLADQAEPVLVFYKYEKMRKKINTPNRLLLAFFKTVLKDRWLEVEKRVGYLYCTLPLFLASFYFSMLGCYTLLFA